jgi:protein-disulfide isomerase
MISVVAVVIALVLVGAALLLTQPKSTAKDAPIAPGIVTPTDIPATGETLGWANAAVTMDLYSDFRCTACFDFYAGAEPKIIKDFVATGKLKIVYHNVLQIDTIVAQQGIKTTASRDAANAGLCAADDGKFWQYHDWLFANNDPQEQPEAYSIDKLIAIAKAAGLNTATFESCVRNGTHNAQVKAEDTAKPAAVTGTPTVYVQGKVVSNPTYDNIALAVNVALGLATPVPTATPTGAASAAPTATPTAAPTATPTAAPTATATAS